MVIFFCTFILFSYINVCIELRGELHAKSRKYRGIFEVRATAYKFTLDRI